MEAGRTPEYVRPYVEANKNDDHDAEAIAEAATRPTMRFVPVKSGAQSDIQALHRARSRLVAERTALINHLRARRRTMTRCGSAPPSPASCHADSPRFYAGNRSVLTPHAIIDRNDLPGTRLWLQQINSSPFFRCDFLLIVTSLAPILWAQCLNAQMRHRPGHVGRQQQVDSY